MIWDIIQQSTFDSYFNDIENLKIQTLLLDQNIITQFKNLNPKLIQQQLILFIITTKNIYSVSNHKQQFLQKLIYYTVILPLQNDNQDRMKKFPYISSQLLSIDNQIIYKSFLQNDIGYNKIDYFKKLMEIFNTQAANNSILLGYFVKIIQSLYKAEKKNVIFYNNNQCKFNIQTARKIYESREIFYKFLYEQSVGTVFQLFLILLETQDGFMIEQRKQVINKIILSFVQDKEEKVKNICKSILIQVINKFQTFSSGDQLLNDILKSQKLLEIFNINDSISIDQFLIGYLIKALQKICSTDDTQQSLINISQHHKQLIKKYILSKKSILTEIDIKQFKNQSRENVRIINKKVINLLILIKLSLQNGILNLFEQKNDIKNLWKLLELHKFNDIVKVKIFQIFGLIYTKNDKVSVNIFEQTYFNESIQIFKLSRQMFVYFLYQLWKVQNKYSKLFQNIPQTFEQDWKIILKNFNQFQTYQKQTAQVIDRYLNRTKINKLIVDEQESMAQNIQKKVQNFTSSIEHMNIQNTFNKQQNQQPKKQTITPTINVFDFSFESKIKIQNKQKVNSKSDPFAEFDFFDVNSKNQQKKAEESKKVADFSDFSSFF